MWIVALALRRPYTFTVFAILILIAGLVSIVRTPKDIFPSINIPVVSVLWNYAGMSPEGMESHVTSLFERGLTTTVDNIEHIESQSLYGIAVDVANETGELYPGAYTQVHLTTGGQNRSLLIPANALLFRSEGTIVGIVNQNNTVELKKIKIGRDLGTQLEITLGLNSDDRVIINPSDSLASGQKVKVRPSQEQKKQASTTPQAKNS
jgi:hypothetical protein